MEHQTNNQIMRKIPQRRNIKHTQSDNEENTLSMSIMKHQSTKYGTNISRKELNQTSKEANTSRKWNIKQTSIKHEVNTSNRKKQIKVMRQIPQGM